MIMTVGAEGQNRTGDTSVFSAVLYRLSYLGGDFMLLRRAVTVKATAVSARARAP